MNHFVPHYYLKILLSFHTLKITQILIKLPLLSNSALAKTNDLYLYLGLALIAIGTGGIKPCVSAFGGDQFQLPEQERQLQTFFSVFYFAINSGSLISTFMTPILRYGKKIYHSSSHFWIPEAAFFLSGKIFAVYDALSYEERLCDMKKLPEKLGNQCIETALSY